MTAEEPGEAAAEPEDPPEEPGEGALFSEGPEKSREFELCEYGLEIKFQPLASLTVVWKAWGKGGGVIEGVGWADGVTLGIGQAVAERLPDRMVTVA